MTKSVVLYDARRFLSAEKSAMLTFATSFDRYKVSHDAQWTRAYDHWQHSMSVVAVNHFGRHETALGDVLQVKSLDGTVVCHVLVFGIRMFDCDRMTDQDARALGYADRDACFVDGLELDGRRAWFIQVERVMPSTSSAEKQ